MSRNTHEGQNLSLNPTETWELIKKSQVHRTVEPIPLNEPLKEGHLRFFSLNFLLASFIFLSFFFFGFVIFFFF